MSTPAAVTMDAPQGPNDNFRENGAPDRRPATADSPRTTIDPAAASERLDNVLQSDIGVQTLLNRLRQSISSARDFAIFLKKRSTLEEEHAQGLKKLSAGTYEMIRRPDNRQGSFAQNYEEVTGIHERMAGHGLQFAMSLHQMSDDLQDLAANMERGRKHWKQGGLNAEKRVQESEAALEKSKGKYYALAEQYDRARTGDRGSGRFGLKGPKSAAQQEEDSYRKLQAADSDYASKVQAAQSQRQELSAGLRPQAVTALRELIDECDSGLTLQLQKFASLNEKLLLGNGLCVSPLKGTSSEATPETRSLREVIQQIDNERDFRDYMLSFSNKAGTKPSEIKYEKHPALTNPRPTQQFSQQSQQQSYGQGGFPPQNQSSRNPSGGYDQGQRPPMPGQTSGVMSYPPPNRDGMPIGPQQQSQYPPGPAPYGQYQQSPYNNQQGPQNDRFNMSGAGPTNRQEADRSGPNNLGRAGTMPMGPNNVNAGTPQMQPNPNYRPGGPPGPGGQNNSFRSDMPPGAPNNNYRPEPQSTVSKNNGRFENGQGNQNGIYATEHRTNEAQMGRNNSYGPDSQRQMGNHSQNSSIAPTIFNREAPKRTDMPHPGLPPLRPVFGVSLDELFRRDSSAVPMIVYQCVQAVDLFGLDVEGIYRTSGSAPHIMEMKALFDNDSSQVDYRNPAAFHHDIASVTTLLKHFLKDLPDPILTNANYNSFIAAAKIDDDIVRRDSLHAVINSLPDPNYATLRVLTLHLNRVAEHHAQNRMTPSNLAICFGPTLMGQQSQGSGAGMGSDIRDAGWQARVVETILVNTFQIFDDDD